MAGCSKRQGRALWNTPQPHPLASTLPRSTTRTPDPRPTGSADIPITATVTQQQSPLASVQLVYVVGYGSQVALPMSGEPLMPGGAHMGLYPGKGGSAIPVHAGRQQGGQEQVSVAWQVNCAPQQTSPSSCQCSRTSPAALSCPPACCSL